MPKKNKELEVGLVNPPDFSIHAPLPVFHTTEFEKQPFLSTSKVNSLPKVMTLYKKKIHSYQNKSQKINTFS